MKSFLSFLMLLFCTSVWAQAPFQNISFTEALQKSAAEGKLILIQFEAKNCTQCNEVADKGLSDKNLSEQLSQTFISLKVNANHRDRSLIASRYNISSESGFGTLFINQAGTLLHKFSRTTTRPEAYADQMDIALSKAGESLKINELEKEYQSGNKSPGLIEELLLKKRTLGLPTDTLLDEYVALLPADSFQSVRTLQFIAQMAPILDSKADIFMRKDPAAFNRAWYGMSLPLRVNTNSAIIYKSMQKAIKNRSEIFAKRTAQFAQGTNNSNAEAASKAYENNMLRYYDAIGDTATYFIKAISYYDRYFMNVPVAAVRRTDSLNMLQMRNATKGDTVRSADGKMMVRKTVAFAPVSQRFTAELNDGAETFYKETTNPYLLNIATQWAKKGLEFYQSPEALNTYAKLLYKQGKKEEAIEAQTNAVALRKTMGFPTAEYEAVIAKMKQNAKLD